MVEAGLSVRAADRVTPWRYKPLIVEAMHGIVPADSLTRQTKANGSGDEEPGLRRHRAELLALWEDSRLGPARPGRRRGGPDRPAPARCRRTSSSACWTRSSPARSGCGPWTSPSHCPAEELRVALTLRAGVSTADTDYGTTLLDERQRRRTSR